MEDSPLSLGKWLAAIWLISNSKNDISSYKVHRSIGVTQKTAWFMLYRIRHALENGSWDKASEEYEVDETFVHAKVVQDTQGKTLKSEVNTHVKQESVVYTGEFRGYNGLLGYVHHVINHSREYVRGHVSTNGIENFWMLFRRCVKGTYIKCRSLPFVSLCNRRIIPLYERECTDGERFVSASEMMLVRCLHITFLLAVEIFLSLMYDKHRGKKYP